MMLATAAAELAKAALLLVNAKAKNGQEQVAQLPQNDIFHM